MESKRKWNQGKKIGSRPQHEWNDALTDLNSLRLSKQEQAKKMNARQSHNLALAKAEAMERSKHKGSPRSFSPALSAKLRASGSKTVEEVLADGSAAIALAHKVRSEDVSDPLNKIESYFYNQIHTKEVAEGQKRYLEEESDEGNLDEIEEIGHREQIGEVERKNERRNELSVIQRRNILPSVEEGMNHYPLSPQGWSNLNNTIQLVVKTCEALWQQLEEERLTRQRLHIQLQEQRSVITTLTAELLQIQEHQEMILKELHAARASSLTYPSARPPFEFVQQQQHPSQERHQLPLKGFSDSLLRRERLPPRSYAFSDSSIEASHPRKTTADPGGLTSRNGRSQTPSADLFRLSYQGKSKSVSQLNREQELSESFQNPLRYSATGVGFLHDSSVLDMLRNYHITDG